MNTGLPAPNNDTRRRMVSSLSDQLERLIVRVEDDAARYADTKVGPTGGGFVIYYLIRRFR